MEIQNSLSSFVRQLMIEHKNSVEVWKKFTDALNSNKESVVVDIENDNGTTEKIQIPSFGWLKSQIERIDNNVQSLSGLNGSNAVNRNADGTFSQIILNTLDKEAPSLSSVNLPTSFNFKNNWFFENFLNPLLYVNFDLTGQIDTRTDRAIVRRYILNLNTDEELDYFEVNYNGRNDLDIDAFEEDLESQGIQYFTDEEIKPIPYQENNLFGSFDVIKIFDDTVDEIADITSQTKRRKKYKLNKLTYSSKSSSLMETETLKVGDSLIVNTGKRNTRYRIINIETSTNIIELDIVEGYDSIQIGANALSFYNLRNSFISLEVPIGFNERLGVFIKPIDPNSNIPADFWSPGVSFFTNDLSIDISNNSTSTLSEFYSEQVVDFGNFLLGVAKDSVPPSINGVQPDPPLLNSNNFQVVEINQHLTRRKAFEEIRKLQNEKNKLNSDIEEIDVAITEKRSELSTTKLASNIERSNIVTELRNFEREKKSKFQLLSSIIDKINNLSAESSVSVNSKYRINGFWSFPAPKTGRDGKNQEIIQFIIEYRYLSKDGDSNSPKQIDFVDNEGNRQTGAQSTWTRVKTDFKSRSLNEETGEFQWDDEDIKDADAVNINQLDIPINVNEKIQIRIKSVSEAGYPINPLKSDFSNIIEVEFPDSLSGNNPVQDIIQEAKNEEIRVEIDNDLASRGLDIHLSDSFTANEKYFAHIANSIDSGFLSPEQRPVALSDKLIDLDTAIARINATLAQKNPELTAVLLDEDGNSFNLELNEVNKVFTGYYRDIVSNLSVKKGVIVNRTFFLTLQNNSEVDLKFRSNEPGPFNKTPFQEFNSGQPFESYDEVPILLNSASTENQSPQVYGQFIYFRKGGLDTNTFYKDNTTGLRDEYMYKPTFLFRDADQATGFVVVDYNGIFGKGTINLVNTGADSEIDKPIYVHIDHPLITLGDPVSIFSENENLDRFGNSRLSSVIQGKNLGIFNDRKIETSNTPIDFDFEISSSDFKQQWSYEDSFNIKQSFKSTDQFLIGPGSCGAYLFPLIRDIQDLRVEGSTINSVRTIAPGDSITIPIIFQFRMTDYFGEGETGLGNVGGDYTQATENLSYTKAIGIDLYTEDNRKFSYDLEFNSIYKSEGATLKNVPGKTFDSTSNSQDIIL